MHVSIYVYVYIHALRRACVWECLYNEIQMKNNNSTITVAT